MILNEAQLKVALRGAYIGNSNCVKFPPNIYKDIMLITASCGRGKTHYALSLDDNGLLAEINRIRQRNNILVLNLQDIKPCEMLFLTSRKVIAVQQLKNSNCVKACQSDFDGNMNDWEKAERENKILVSTAHYFGELVKKGLVKRKPKVIVIDELHSVFAETIFADSLIYTIEYLKDNYKDMVKIGLTATPQFLLKYINDDVLSFHIIDLDLGSKYKVNDINCYVRGQAKTILKQIKPKINSDYKVIYYTMSAKECYQLSTEYERSAFLISDYNETMIDGKPLVEIMNEAGVKQYIIENECLPKDIDIIFINSACREGMNIKDNAVKAVICEAVDMITIEQILGRIRNDLEKFMVICNFNNAEKVNKNIKELQSFLAEISESDNDQVVLSHRHGKQEENKYLQKYVYFYNGEYRLNTYARAYLQYINESYIQIKNYETKSKENYIYKVADRDLLLCNDYLKQLCRYSEGADISIEQLWDAVVNKNHDNAVCAFQQIEDEWMNKPLNSDDKKELVSKLQVVRSKGQKASWKTTKDMLLNAGYTITDKNTGGKRFSIISR